MRHLWSLIAGVVVAPLGWGLLAMGQAGASATATSWAAANAFDTADLVKPACYLAAAGILFGLIATLHISPLGPLVAALVYLGLNVGVFIDPFEVRDAVPNNWKVFGETVPLRTPLLNGTLLAVGALLLVAVVSAKRWRQWPAAAPVPAEPEAPGPMGEEPAGPDTWPQRVPAPEPVTAAQPPMAPLSAPTGVQAPTGAVQPPLSTPYAAPEPAPAEPTTASWPPPSPATEPVRPPAEAVRAPAEPIPPPAEPARPASPPHPEPASGPTSAPPAPPAPPMTAPVAPTAPVWPPQSEPGADEPAGPRHAADNATDNGEQSPGGSPSSPWTAPPPSR